MFFKLIFYWIIVDLQSSVLGVQQKESVIRIHISILSLQGSGWELEKVFPDFFFPWL